MKEKPLLYGEALGHTRNRRITKEEIRKERGRRLRVKGKVEQINGEIQLRIDHQGQRKIITSPSGWNDGVGSAMQDPDWVSRSLCFCLWDWFIYSIVWLAPFEPC